MNPTTPKAPRILIVEDESIIAMTIEQTLHTLGFAVAGTTRTGEQAVEMAGQIRPDLILMDIRLAGKMDGIEAAAQIRGKFQVPVVYLTSHSDSAILARAKITEPSGYILKPFEDRDLQIAIEMGLYKHWAEIRIRQLQKMESFGQLAGGIAHNFNNLLTVIQGYSGMIKNRSGSDPETLAAIEQVQDAANCAAHLTRQLLAFSQRQVLERRVFDIDQVVENTLEILRGALPLNIRLAFRSGGAFRIEGDESMIEQAIFNLVVNARDAMPNGGAVEIETRDTEIGSKDLEHHKEAQAGHFVQLTVSDTGLGIDSETQGRIFEPFFTTKDISSGAGLGLSAAHGIIKQHHGWIEVASKIGAGTRFDIFLPLSSIALPVAEAPPVVRPGPQGNETILLVEDLKPLRMMLRLILEKAGYRIIEAETGRKAMEIWDHCAGEVTLVMTDILMPGGVSGRELAEWLNKRNPKLKIILTSGYAPGEADREFVARVGGAYLVKPYPRDKLLQTVRECLDR